MKKDEKDKNKKDIDSLLERLTQKAIKWDAEKDDLDENNPLDKEPRDKQDADREEKDN